MTKRAPGLNAWRRAGALLLTMLLGAWAGPLAAAPDAALVAETLRRSVEQLHVTGQVIVAGQRLRSASVLPELYQQRGFTLLWTTRANEEAMLGEIAAVSGDGLDPEDYHFDALRELLRQRREAPDDAALAAAADLLLSDALARLVAHLARGKLDPSSGAPRWDLDGVVRGEPATAVLARIATGNAVAVQLGELRPVQPIYGRLKSMLARYRVVAEQGGWPEIGAGPVLQQGMEDPRIPLLRRRLAQTGDFPGVVIDSPRFEPALEAALRAFQARHQLDADGRFGPATRRAMNRPVDDLMALLRANLERARWLLADVRGRLLVIDPAGRQVTLLDHSEPIATFAAELAPGVAQMLPFRGELHYLVVNPDWVLPPDLVAAQLAPLARRAPDRIEALDLQVFREDGTQVSPRAASWAAPGKLIVRQLPGPRSFLGEYRFPVWPRPEVFLHGGASSGESLPGAVRLADASGLATALATPEAGFGPEQLAAALAAGTPRTLSLRRPVTAVFAPWTAWVDPAGTVFFRGGFEDADAGIIAGLARRAGAD
jgi:murein L,D-transpeptidase YcbB/YkuD